MENKALINKINDIWEKDQKIRLNRGIPLKNLREHDIRQTALVKEIYAKNGLITSREYPMEVVNIFTLLVQHALDVRFAEEYLHDLLEHGLEEDKKKAPFLIDKILVSQDKKQIYGTIVSTRKNSDGSLITKPKPCIDQDNIDVRRKSVGLSPMGEYLIRAEELYKKINR